MAQAPWRGGTKRAGSKPNNPERSRKTALGSSNIVVADTDVATSHFLTLRHSGIPHFPLLRTTSVDHAKGGVTS